MKKIGIVTIYSFNYGNRLQNYALERYLQRFGKCYTLHIPRNAHNPVYLIKKLVHVVRGKDSSDMGSRFDRKLHFSHKQGEKASEYFDYFVAGSDQIWNPNYFFNTDREFLTFARPEQRIAYAASIGINSLPDNQRERYRNNLLNMKAISMREQRGCEIVKELTGRDVPVVLDPTMLLTADEWSQIAKRSKYRGGKKYVFQYILGGGEENDNYGRWVENYAQKADMDVIKIHALNNKVNQAIGPAEFVDLIQHAELVCTDSFHASVFSILFHRPFVIFERKEKQDSIDNMNSRMDTLLEMFGLEGNRVEYEGDLEAISSRICFDKVDGILEEKRKVAYNFLREALHN